MHSGHCSGLALNGSVANDPKRTSLLNRHDKPTMGEYCNNVWQNLIGGFIVVSIIVLSTLFGISVMFPDLFQ